MTRERKRWELRGVPYPPIVLDRAANRPLYRQIEVSLRRSILDGRIGPGTVLPGIRAYAKHLGVAAVTVMTAYDQLTAEGYLEPRPGRGTLVAPDLPDIRRGLRTHTSAGVAALPPIWSTGPRRPFFGGARREPRYDFRTGATRLDLFPVALWERLLPRAWRDLVSDPASATTYRYPEGDPRLRAELAAYLGLSRAVRTSPEQVVVTAGAQSAMATAARVWLGDGRILALEDPGSPHLQRIFEAFGTPTTTSRSTTAGSSSTACPTARPPSWSPRRGSTRNGGTMPVARRMQLLAWAARNESVIIEDDCDSELRYEGHPQPSLQGLDEQGRVLYIGTFSKVLYPGLRVGYAVVPGRTSRRSSPATRLAIADRGRSSSGRSHCSSPKATSSGTWPGCARLRRAPGGAARHPRLGARAVVSARPAAAGAHLVVRIEDVQLTATELAARAWAIGVASSRSRSRATTRPATRSCCSTTGG